MKFFTRFDRNPKRSDFFSEMKSKTQQHFKEQSDVNWIIKHYQEIPANALGSVDGPRMPLWGDFSNVPDIQSAHRAFQQAEASFSALPAAVRLRFGNNPLELLAFVSDSSNRAEAEKLGLVEKGAPPPQVVGKVDGVAAVNAETVAEQH